MTDERLTNLAKISIENC